MLIDQSLGPFTNTVYDRDDRMINKQNLWFLTLFSLILVLSVYYITMPSELLLTTPESSQTEEEPNTTTDPSDVTTSITESDILVAMRVDLDDERTTVRETLQEVLTDTEASTEDKNNAYEQLKQMDEVRAKEAEIEKKLKDTYSLENFVQIDGNQVTVVLISSDHNNQLANKIMRSVQENFTDKVYVTVKFEA